MYSTKQSIPVHPNSTQWALIQSNTLHYNTIQYSSIPYCTKPYPAIPWYAECTSTGKLNNSANVMRLHSKHIRNVSQDWDLGSPVLRIRSVCGFIVRASWHSVEALFILTAWVVSTNSSHQYSCPQSDNMVYGIPVYPIINYPSNPPFGVIINIIRSNK